ncbi:sigma-70 family RNA polymerase sigma factor [Nonomuraea sp. FMUSA5-5]|uniref:Sigma-70 family RNA polymerase sigma factor n=1 Tax=Nonomuraea composti TaxID=2720023 RepID=A0ABX1AXC3_9ACTN|nr:sigma-70 family RNA polymerase sigma factor [Nonomuraea sp. FMUSA5-5]NJP88246.1 sigma-70 family RNA polymerase sigma factor [Nonomuraea sp. FMUSA5-5]
MTGDPALDPALDPARDAGLDPAADPAPRRAPTPRAQRRDRLAALLVEARQGDRDALDAIVAELTPVLWHTARNQGLSRQAAEDVIQTTWLTLLRHLHAISVPGALIEWLVTTARREAWRVSRASRKDDLPGDDTFDDLPDPVLTPDELLVDDERRRALWHAVESLPKRCAELLRIIAFVPRPHYDAVAAALNMPLGSIGPTRGRCFAKLRLLLAKDPDWSS